MVSRVFDITDAELALLKVLWIRKSETLRELTNTVYRSVTHGRIATVKTLLDRLEAKNFVTHDRSVRPHRFEAAVDRDAVIKCQLQLTAKKLCNMELEPILMVLIKQVGSVDRKMAMTLLAELDCVSKRSSRKRRG